MFPQIHESGCKNFLTNSNSNLLLQNTVDVSRINKEELLEIINRLKHKLYVVKPTTEDTKSGTSTNNDYICCNSFFADNNMNNSDDDNTDGGTFRREIKETGNLLVDARTEMFVQQFACKKIVETAHLVTNGSELQIMNDLSEALHRLRRKSKRYELVSLKGIYTQDCDTPREYNHKFSLIHEEARRAIANCREYKNRNIDIILRQKYNREETQFAHKNLKRSQAKNLLPITLEGMKRGTEVIKIKTIHDREAKGNQKFNGEVTTDPRNHSSAGRDKIQEKIDAVEKPMRINDAPAYFNEKVALDILGPLPETNQGNKFILIVQDCFTRFTRIYALPDKDYSLVVDTLLNTYFLIFGFPSRILTERNSSFAYISFLDLRQNFGIEQVDCRSSCNEDNNVPEYRYAAFMEYLKLNRKERDWDNNLWTFSVNYNATPNNRTGYSPVQLLCSKSTASNGESAKNNSRIHKDCLLDLRERLATLQVHAKE